MASKSYYTVDERTRQSVMAAIGRGGTRSINEIHKSMRPQWSRGFDQNAFLTNIGHISIVIEGICLNGTNAWTKVQRLQPDLLSRLYVPPVNRGHDRATLSLYDPVLNLGEMCDSFWSQVNAWATKATYFSEVSYPVMICNVEAATSDAEAARIIRETLEYVGPIDRAYTKRFKSFALSMVDPLEELRSLEQFIASILAEEYPIFFDDSKLEETGSTANPHDPGSPIYEPPDRAPSSPVGATTLPALASLTLDEPSRDPESSSALQTRSTLYDIKPDTTPQGTPQWKKDLSERKGHRIHLLHVTDSELDILAKTLSYLYNVTSKADECFEFIIMKRNLAKSMRKAYKEWAEECEFLEEYLSQMAEEETSGTTGGDRLEYNDGNSLRAESPLSGSRYVPHTMDLDTATTYNPYANTSGYRQLQHAAGFSSPAPNAQHQSRRKPSSIINLEDYDLDARAATPTPAHYIRSDPSSPSFEDEDAGSEDSDRTIRIGDVGEGGRRWLGSPVPFDDDDYEDDDDEVGEVGDDGEDAGHAAWAPGPSAYPTIASGSSTTTAAATTAAHNNPNPNNTANATNEQQPFPDPHANANAAKSLRDSKGKRIGLYGEEL